MIRHAALTLGLTLIAVRCTAQVQTAPDSVLGDTLLIDRPLTGVSDSFRITLVQGGQYRVSLSPGAATLEAISADKRLSTAFPARVREGAGANPTIIELYPPRTADYVVRVRSAAGLVGGRIQVWSDRKLAESKQEQRDRAWGIGLGLAAGWHSGYYTGADDANGGQSGSALETCILVGSSGPVSGCLGFTRQELGSDVNAISWFFIEPRVRLVSIHSLGRPLDVILSARLGQGSSERLGVDPSLIAPGLLLSYHLDDRPGARGWKATFQVLYAFLGNVDTPYNSDFAQLTLGLSWIP